MPHSIDKELVDSAKLFPLLLRADFLGPVPCSVVITGTDGFGWLRAKVRSSAKIQLLFLELFVSALPLVNSESTRRVEIPGCGFRLLRGTSRLIPFASKETLQLKLASIDYSCSSYLAERLVGGWSESGFWRI